MFQNINIIQLALQVLSDRSKKFLPEQLLLLLLCLL